MQNVTMSWPLSGLRTAATHKFPREERYPNTEQHKAAGTWLGRGKARKVYVSVPVGRTESANCIRRTFVEDTIGIIVDLEIPT
jgi:hypothetical protein